MEVIHVVYHSRPKNPAMIRRHLSLIPIALLVASPLSAAPHERWVPHSLLHPYDRTPFREWTLLGVVLAALCGTLLAAGAWRAWRAPRVRIAEVLDSSSGTSLLRIATGLGLLLLAYEGAYMAPDLLSDGSLWGRFLISLTTVTAIGLVSDWRTATCAKLLSASFLLAVVVRPFHEFDGKPIQPANVLMYFELLAVFGYLARVATSGARSQRRRTAVRLLQRVVAANILVHGILKIVHPDLPVGVVQNHVELLYEPVAEWIPLSLEGFVLCAATVEIGLGSALFLGVLPDLVLMTLIGVVATTALVFQGDLLGHLPRTGAALVMLLAERGNLARRAQILPELQRLLANFRRHQIEWNPRRLPRDAILPLSIALVLGLALPPSPEAAEVTGVVALRPSDDYVPPPRNFLPEPLHLGRSLGAQGVRKRLHFELAPLSDPGVGQIFELAFEVTRTDGAPYEGEIQVSIGMPRHGHGMPTKPRLKSLGAGAYRFEGCQFNMFGLWTVHLVAPGVDEVVLELRHRPENMG